MGKVRVPQYRIVVVDSRKKRDGRVIEEIGKYHPKEEPSPHRRRLRPGAVLAGRRRAAHRDRAVAAVRDRRLAEVQGLRRHRGPLKHAAEKRSKLDIFNEALKEAGSESVAATTPKSSAKDEKKDEKAAPAATETPAVETPEGATEQAEVEETKALDAEKHRARGRRQGRRRRHRRRHALLVTVSTGMLAEALEHLVRGVVDHPDDVRVDDRDLRRGSVLEVRVHPTDLGKVNRARWPHGHTRSAPSCRRWPVAAGPASTSSTWTAAEHRRPGRGDPQQMTDPAPTCPSRWSWAGSVVRTVSRARSPSRSAPTRPSAGSHRVSTSAARPAATRRPPRRVADLEVASVREHQGRLLVRFDGFADRDGAETLRGTLLHTSVPADETPEDPDEFYDHQLVGLRAEDLDGHHLGEVVRVVHGAQDLLEVRTPQGHHGLVPFVAALVPEVDVPGGRVVVADRPGLVTPFPDDAPAHEDAPLPGDR